MAHHPTRDDEVARWLKGWRDQYPHEGCWHLLDDVLEDYRLHADTGTPLSEDVREC